jgi:hypothetical protein
MPELRGPERLLWRLEAAKRVSEGKWIARCPAHEDRSPSLSIGIGRDGRVLIHCHAGCEPLDILAAVGLEMADLFPDGPLYHHAKGVLRHNAARAYHEAIVEIAAADLRHGKRLTRDDVAVLKRSREWLSRNAEIAI